MAESLVTSTGGVYLLDVTHTGSGQVIAGGEHRVNTVAFERLLVGLSGDGKKVLWKTQPDVPDVSYVASLVGEENGALLAGNILVNGLATVFVQRVNDKGASVWQRLVGFRDEFATAADVAVNEGIAMAPRTLVKLPDGGLALAAQVKVGDFWVAGLAKLDPWGEGSCLEAGKCVSETPKSCDDGNPCTIDWCHPNSGCKHTTAPATPCGAGKVCKGQVCSKS